MNIKTIMLVSVSLAGAMAFAEETQTLPPVAAVEDVSYVQSGTRQVTVGYKLTGARAIVTLDVLTNGVSVGGTALANVAGDVNRWLEPGEARKTIVWRPRQTIPDLQFKNGEVSVVVKAWDAGTMPPYLAVDLRAETPADGRISYYASEGAVPGGISNDLYKTDAILLKLVPAAGESFAMGSPATETSRNAARERHHMVTFTNDFYMGIYPVTIAQHKWATDNENAQSDPRGAWSWESYESLRGATVNWPSTGHDVGGASHLGKWRSRFGVDFDVPTSAQWEYVCRAGTRTVHFWGTDTNQTTIAKYGYSAIEKTNVVGTHLPNGWGFYEMTSQPWEWCLDWTGSTEGLSAIEPTGPLTADTADQSRRVGRGSGNNYDGARSAKVNPQLVTGNYGYRLICPVTLKW